MEYIFDLIPDRTVLRMASCPVTADSGVMVTASFDGQVMVGRAWNDGRVTTLELPASLARAIAHEMLAAAAAVEAA